MTGKRVYTVAEAFEILKAEGITTNIESVRRWLRTGKIEGIEPVARKTGWTVTEAALNNFIATCHAPLINATEVVALKRELAELKAIDEAAIRADEREKIWYELRRIGMAQDYLEIKKTYVKDAIEHRQYSDDLFEEVWARLVDNNAGRGKRVTIAFLLDAVSFEGKRIPLDKGFELRQEQIVFAIIEYVRKHRRA